MFPSRSALDQKHIFSSAIFILSQRMRQVKQALPFVTDAWFFKEGEARRWAVARFGEFRVDPDGNAMLITLRAKNLQELRTKKNPTHFCMGFLSYN